MLAQFVNRRMIVVLDLIGHGQIGGIEDPRLAAEELEQARGLFNHEPRIGSFAQGAIEQQDARRRIEFAQTQRRTTMSIFRSEEHTSELQSLMRISYAVFCLKKKQQNRHNNK